jgi:hypothetical protein
MIVEKLTKLDAARRQIDEAIRMFFERRDTVSTHTVAAAAAQVLADLGKSRGFQGWTRNKTLVKEGHWKEWRAAIAKCEQFFKHADQDPDATCDFHPEITQFFLVESVEMLRMFTGKFTWSGLIFSIWFSATYPEVLQETEFKRAITAKSSLLNLSKDFSIFADLLRMEDALAPDDLKDSLL